MNSSLELPTVALFPAHEVVRVLLVSADHARAALNAVSNVLSDRGVELCSLTLKPVGEIVEAILRLKGLDDPAAEALACSLAGATGVHAVRVEHHWGL